MRLKRSDFQSNFNVFYYKFDNEIIKKLKFNQYKAELSENEQKF